MDPTFLIEGVGGGAAAVGVVRKRLRSPRVRRDPIDIQLVEAERAEAELAEAGHSPDADEILAALEAEVGRAASRRAAVAEPTVVPAPAAPAVPAPTVVPPAPVMPTPRMSASGTGIAPDQVREWMSQVQDDLRKVRARTEYLRVEQARLEEQQRLMAQLITSSTPL